MRTSETDSRLGSTPVGPKALPSENRNGSFPVGLKLAYTVKEATKAIGLSRSTLYAMMKAETLRFVKVGNRRLIPAEALRELLDRGAEASSSRFV